MSLERGERRRRPVVPEALRRPGGELRPSRALEEWARATFVDEGGPLYHDEHRHLAQARIGWLWASVPHVRRGRAVRGTAEIPRPSPVGNAWERARYFLQLTEWFGGEIDFLITLYAPWAAEAQHDEFCAVAEHEILHCGQAVNLETGARRFRKSGIPVWCIRGHSIEEFSLIIQRYGSRAIGEHAVEYLRAAMSGPTVTDDEIRAACGTCLRRAA